MSNQLTPFHDNPPTTWQQNFAAPNTQAVIEKFSAVCAICLNFTQTIQKIDPIIKQQESEYRHGNYERGFNESYYRGFTEAYNLLTRGIVSQNGLSPTCSGRLEIMQTQVKQVIEKKIQQLLAEFKHLQQAQTYGERANREEAAIKSVRFITNIARTYINNLQTLLDYIEGIEISITTKKEAPYQYTKLSTGQKQEYIRGYMRIVNATDIQINIKTPPPQLASLIIADENIWREIRHIENEMNEAHPLKEFLLRRINEQKIRKLENKRQSLTNEIKQYAPYHPRKQQAEEYIQKITDLEHSLIGLIQN